VPIKRRLSELKNRLRETIEEAQTNALARAAPTVPTKPGDEPPVVARLMVEIRSDGSQTIARGAVEDIATGDRVAVEARGATPAQLAASLARTMLSAPLLARAAARAVLEARPSKRRGNDED
jgi:hypothetical protein